MKLETCTNYFSNLSLHFCTPLSNMCDCKHFVILSQVKYNFFASFNCNVNANKKKQQQQFQTWNVRDFFQITLMSILVEASNVYDFNKICVIFCVDKCKQEYVYIPK